MLRYMLDTNICIYVIKNRPPKIRDRFTEHAEHLCISSVTLAELLYGAEKSTRIESNLSAWSDGHRSAGVDVRLGEEVAGGVHRQTAQELGLRNQPVNSELQAGGSSESPGRQTLVSW